jgi:acetylornithine/N-succinyldiaminopimelate aminotransferase
MDEVQTGIGRTGTLFSYQSIGAHPDAVSFAKGIAGGLPLGGMLVSKKVSGVLGSGTHATTFGANPICCAAALAVLEILTDDGVMAEVASKGDYIRSKIESMNLGCVREVRGAGLMIGVAVKGITPGDAVKQLISEGLLALTAGTDVIRFLPPLTISYPEIDRGLGVFERTLSRL